MSALVSIVTVSLDAVDTIGDTLASVHGQRAAFPIEHVCVDGGSTDGTRELIDQWAVRSAGIVRVYERDRGIFDAMNKGLARARGAYVLYLNADDYLASADALAHACSGLEPGRSDAPDLLMGDVVMGRPGSVGLWRHRCVPRLLPRLRGTGCFALHQGMLARRELLERVGGFDATLRLAADVNQYYDLERLHSPRQQLLRRDLAVMRPGGAANAGLAAMVRGSVEIYDHLRQSRGRLRSLAMVGTKTLQSLSELRYGRVPGSRWFDGRQARADTA